MFFYSMKNILAAFLFLGFLSNSQISIDSIRTWYALSVEDEDKAESMTEFLTEIKNKSAIEFAYLASAQALLGHHAYNPYNKLYWVKTASPNFDKAVKLEPNNPEIRFLRFAVEHYVPSFLGYSEHVEKDLNYLFNYAINSSENLYKEESFKTIVNFLIETDRLEDSDLVKIELIQKKLN